MGSSVFFGLKSEALDQLFPLLGASDLSESLCSICVTGIRTVPRSESHSVDLDVIMSPLWMVVMEPGVTEVLLPSVPPEVVPCTAITAKHFRNNSGIQYCGKGWDK